MRSKLTKAHNPGFWIFLLIFLPAIACPTEPFGWYAKGNSGMVTAGEQGSVAAGLEILQQGGNAADAAAATILALSITDYGDFCIGGEVPLLYYSAGENRVRVLSGQGGTPLDSGAIRWYYDYGIPLSDVKAAAVPAVIDLCVTLLREFGTRSFERIVQPALTILESNEENWYLDLSVTLARLVEAERARPGSRSDKLQAVSDRFYRGDIADSLAVWYRSKGGFLTNKDLAAHTTHIEDPVSIQYRDYTIYKCDTWTQGPVLLQALRLLEGFNLKAMGSLSAEHIHTVAEAMKLALADRDAHYGDPRFVDVPLELLFSDRYTELRRELLDPGRASDLCRPGDPVRMKAIKEIGRYVPSALPGAISRIRRH